MTNLPGPLRSLVRALEKTNTDDSVASLVGALRDESFERQEIRCAIVGSNGEIPPPRAIWRLVSKIQLRGGARVAAACALRAIGGWKPSTKGSGRGSKSPSARRPWLLRCQRAAPHPLMADHKHDTTFQRREAADALSRKKIGAIFARARGPCRS